MGLNLVGTKGVEIYEGIFYGFILEESHKRNKLLMV